MASENLREYSDLLSHKNLAQFLAVNEWSRQNDRVFDETWTIPEPNEDRLLPILIPKTPTFDDYQRRLEEAYSTVASFYGWKVQDLIEQVMAVRADLFFVRVDQFSKDGTIPLRQASTVLDGIESMVRSMAILTNNPNATGKGRVSAPVNNFLEKDLRMGHTKHGSFIITVAARLEDSETSEETKDSPVNEKPLSFTRRVMTNLASSLSATREYLNEESSLTLEQAEDKGMVLPLVKGLQDIVEIDSLRSVDLSFEWAPILKQEVEVSSFTRLESGDFQKLAETERKLNRAIKPKETEFFGFIEELKRPDISDSGLEENQDIDSGTVVIRADIDGRFKKVLLDLDGRQYNMAIEAHRSRSMMQAVGTLRKDGRYWRLDQPVLSAVVAKK